MNLFFGRKLVRFFVIFLLPMIVGLMVMRWWAWDFSVPFVYGGSDDVWQLIHTKVLFDTGWILTNPYLGAPGVAAWHFNPAGQTSALHSVLMLIMSPLFDDAVRLQQAYFVINFSLICAAAYFFSRQFGFRSISAFCIGMVFAFSTSRVVNVHYAYLSNYFCIPLALIPAVWVYQGRFNSVVESGFRNLFISPSFYIGAVCSVVVAVSDGYYAFFTLLLMGFGAVVRILSGDVRRVLRLFPAAIYCGLILACSLALQLPLYAYKNSHHDEFYPNGQLDASLVKHPFEAEVYTTSLKMMVAPIPDHRLASVGEFGDWVFKTSDEARKFIKGRSYVPFGTLGSIVLLAVFLFLMKPELRPGYPVGENVKERDGFEPVALAFILFSFLCSISGGVGTLVALAFPTIRAYERFAIFTLFFIYAYGFALLERGVVSISGWRWALPMGCVLVTAFLIWDQVPPGATGGNPVVAQQFLAERRFVNKVEADLPKGAMVYQYPYSQYLQNNKYYGWGSFAHIRLYMHSHGLRWSNGASRNSYVDNFIARISEYPTTRLLAEVRALGFAGMVIDRKYLGEADYKTFVSDLRLRGLDVEEDVDASLSFVRFSSPDVLIKYDETYTAVERVQVLKTPDLIRSDVVPREISFLQLKKIYERSPDLVGREILAVDYPGLLKDSSAAEVGRGGVVLKDISTVNVDLSCRFDRNAGRLFLRLSNKSDYDFDFSRGRYPWNVGFHQYKSDGSLVRFDDGVRLPLGSGVLAGEVKDYVIDMALIPNFSVNGGRYEFVLVQDGNAWFSKSACSI